MTELFKNKYRSKSLRLQGYDYSSDSAYFITLCTSNHICEFGEIVDDEMILNDYGKIVKNEWLKSEVLRENLTLGVFCIMPNHIHGIVIIGNPVLPLEGNAFPIQDYYNKNKFGAQHQSLSTFINQFKGSCTRAIKKSGNKLFAWQRNYYEHIIRNQNSLTQIEQYIKNNPHKWTDDKYNL